MAFYGDDDGTMGGGGGDLSLPDSNITIPFEQFDIDIKHFFGWNIYSS